MSSSSSHYRHHYLQRISSITAFIVFINSFHIASAQESYCYRDSIVGAFDNHNVQPTSWTCYSSIIDTLYPTTSLEDLSFLDYNASTGNFQPLHAISNYYVYLLVHDYQGSAYDEWVLDMARSLYERAMYDHPIPTEPSPNLDGVQIIAVDWSRSALSGGMAGRGPRYAYSQAVLNAIESARIFGNRLNDLITDYAINPNAPFANIHCIGHGVGAHICGISSKVFKAGRPFWKPFNRITALDPARVLFEPSNDNVSVSAARRLDSRDAFFVDAIHTTSTYGYIGKIGIIDHYVNGDGESGALINMQPGCETEYCSHARAIELFQSTIPGPAYSMACIFNGCSWENYQKSCRLGYDAPADCGFHPAAKFCGYVSEPHC